MRGTYREDRTWSDERLDIVKALIGRHIMEAGNEIQDMQKMGDLVVLGGKETKIGVRIRTGNFRENFRYDFTLRTWRSSGAKTEFEKILEGWGDYFFYGFSPERNSTIIDPWYLLSLDAFRHHWRCSRDMLTHGEVRNRDNATGFRWFNILSFPKTPSILVHASEPVPYQVFSSTLKDAHLKDVQNPKGQLEILFPY